ncbi:hypothetical protein HD554DRAFT_2043206 [Boletus coccyginus]|nr:hypothetical protein HD554DRAFT_2043206 [Boletus coccyginus]
MDLVGSILRFVKEQGPTKWTSLTWRDRNLGQFIAVCQVSDRFTDFLTTPAPSPPGTGGVLFDLEIAACYQRGFRCERPREQSSRILRNLRRMKNPDNEYNTGGGDGVVTKQVLRGRTRRPCNEGGKRCKAMIAVKKALEPGVRAMAHYGVKELFDPTSLGRRTSEGITGGSGALPAVNTTGSEDVE